MSRFFTQKLSAALDSNSNGTIQLYAEFEFHPDMSSFAMAFPDYVSPVEMAGFSHSNRHQCEWEGSVKEPWIRFRLNVNRTNRAGYEFIDTGAWALFKFPPINTSWRYSGSEIELKKEYSVTHEGVVSSDGSIAYLGPHAVERFRAGGQLFHLVLPSRASLRASLRDVKDSLSFAAEQLGVGGRDEEVVVVAAPSSVNWGWGGLQSGSNGFWAVDTSRVDHANNTWIHEYVHTRQEWTRHNSTDWLVEGTTNYYAALLTLLQGRISFRAFHRYLMTGRDSDSVLSDPSQWTSPNAHYSKGRRVTAALDAKVRRETDGRRSFEDVFRRLNAVEDALTHRQFENVLTDVVGHSLSRWLRKYVEGSQMPVIPEDERLFTDLEVSDTEPESIPETETETETVTPPESEDETLECPVCGESVTSDQQFCKTCGTELFKQCPVCGRDVTDEPYCPECGTAMQPECDACGHRCHASEEFCPSCGTEV